MTTDSMVTTGVTGGIWRAGVSPWGSIHPWDGAAPLQWFIAADDRWHLPADEAAVRQVRLEGSAITETRVRVPNGDVVQRVYSVADAGGVTVVEVENESTMPVAIAFDRRDLLTERPIADVPIEGIELGPDAFVLPLGHHATLRVGMPHGGGGPGLLPASLPSATQVARGWLTLIERASRLVLPDGERGASLAAEVAAMRCELALGVIPTAVDDPAGYTIALGELVRMGERPDHWLPELVEAVELLGPVSSWTADAGLAAADRVLAEAGEGRARRDLARIRANRAPSVRPAAVPTGVAKIVWLESRLAADGALLPEGVPVEWLGSPIEVYGVPTGGSSAVSYAIRWHGARPAVLWEQTGDVIELTAPVAAPEWSTTEASGEALWPAPPGAPAGESPSFS